jgi:hypothetical protein
MSQLLVLLVIGFVIFVCHRYIKYRAEQRLRENPAPRRVIEISLPRGETNSAERQARALRKVASAALGGSKERRKGLRQFDLIYMFEVPMGKTEPIGRFLMYCDPDKMDSVKRAIKQTYGQVAAVQELKADQDPMAEIAAALRPPPPTGDVDPSQQAPEPSAGQLSEQQLAALAAAQAQMDAEEAGEHDQGPAGAVHETGRGDAISLGKDEPNALSFGDDDPSALSYGDDEPNALSYGDEDIFGEQQVDLTEVSDVPAADAGFDDVFDNFSLDDFDTFDEKDDSHVL